MSNYIQDLRKIVGHRVLMQCAASVIIENEKGQVLLGRRTDNHQWTYAGGSLEIDETVEEAAKRELREEMGLIAEELEFFMINSGPEAHYIYPNGDEVTNVEIIYICRKYHGTIKAQEEEIGDLQFFDVKDIPEDISEPIRPVFREYIKMRGGDRPHQSPSVTASPHRGKPLNSLICLTYLTVSGDRSWCRTYLHSSFRSQGRTTDHLPEPVPELPRRSSCRTCRCSGFRRQDMPIRLLPAQPEELPEALLPGEPVPERHPSGRADLRSCRRHSEPYSFPQIRT